MAFVANSSLAGFLTSITPIPNDRALEDALNPTIAGITGLNGDRHVRPRFQEDPPDVPDRSVDWVSFGIMRVTSDLCAATNQLDALTAEVVRYQELEVLLSWYGPNSSNLCELFRDGLQIGQNRQLLEQSDLAIISVGDSMKAPELFKQKYLTRFDQTIVLRRRTARVFAIKQLVSFGIRLNTDPVGETPIDITYAP